MKLKDYLHYYYQQQCLEAIKVPGQELHYEPSKISSRTLFNIEAGLSEVKLVLRRLEDMTEEEMVNLLTDLFPFDMEDKPTADEFSMEMFYNDDGLMVDGDVSVGANYTCRCYEGQIAIKQCGTICFFDEAGNQEHGINIPKAYHYLLCQQFDLFGLIDAGLAIDAKTLTP